MRMSSSSTCGSRPSTPSAVVFMPNSRARLRPSELGSMPTIHTGSIHSERSIFITRSVPILPGPIMAALSFLLMGVSSVRSGEAHRGAADAADFDAHEVAGLDRLQGYQRTGENHFTGLQRDAETAQGIGQPGHAVDRRTQGRCAGAGAEQLAVLLHQHAAGDQVDLAWRHRRIAEHEQAAGGLVRYCVLYLDFSVADVYIDDLETWHHALGGGQHVGVGHAGADQVLLEDEGDLALGLGLHQPLADRHGLAAVEHHGIGQEAEVRLIHAQHVLHRLAGDADLLADDLLAGGQPAFEHAQGDVVGVVDADGETALGQRRDRLAVEHRLVQLVAELVDQYLVHKLSLSQERGAASARKSSTRRAKRPACSIWVQWPQWP